MPKVNNDGSRLLFPLFYACFGRLQAWQRHVKFLLFHLSKTSSTYIYTYTYTYTYTSIFITWYFSSSFSLLGRNLARKRGGCWLNFIVIKSCFNSQDKHLKLQLFHVLLVGYKVKSCWLKRKNISLMFFPLLWPALSRCVGPT